ncbi:hypothetical protein [Rubrobacter indicoceani]|uniref:hypothetical protein n=1 Tax=Rubrobacter indicoceani TaxID=2051957 RepID=UPI00196934F1
MGASIGDYLSQEHSAGGLQLGTVEANAIFLGTIFFLVLFLSFAKADRIEMSEAETSELLTREKNLRQTA